MVNKGLRSLQGVNMLDSKFISPFMKSHSQSQKSPFMIYADFESILVPEDNGKQNPNEFYRNKFETHVACCYGYKLVCVDDV